MHPLSKTVSLLGKVSTRTEGEEWLLWVWGAKDLGSQGLGWEDKIFLDFGFAKCLGVWTGLVTNFCNLGTGKSGKILVWVLVWVGKMRGVG